MVAQARIDGWIASILAPPQLRDGTLLEDGYWLTRNGSEVFLSVYEMTANVLSGSDSGIGIYYNKRGRVWPQRNHRLDLVRLVARHEIGKGRVPVAALATPPRILGA